MSTQKVYPVYSFQYIQNKLVELSRQKLNTADVTPQVQADWIETDVFSPAYIKNKPTIPSTIGDVVGPSSAVNNDVALFDGTTGKIIKDSGILSTDLMLKSVYDIDNTGVVDKAEGIAILGRNSTGATLYKGSVVYISGSTGNRPNFTLAQANAEATSAGTFGMILADIPNNTDGYVMSAGYVDNLDTRTTAPHPITSVTLADGDKLYLDPNTAGYVTNVKPSAPNHLVYIGVVTRTSPTNGTIVLRIQNGYELEELHNVAITTPSNNDVVVYESSTSLWKNKTLATILGYTPVPTTRTLTINGTTYDLSADRTWTISSGMTNPMTSVGDLILGTTAGAPSRLGIGTNGQVLTSNGTTASWQTPSSGGMSNPMTTAGDIIYGGASGTPTRLGIGTSGWVLQAGTSAPSWFNLFGTANTWTGVQTFNPSVTASGALARAMILTSTLTAAANNDILVGLDINPTYSSGAFTGVKHMFIRTPTTNLSTARGGIYIGGNNFAGGTDVVNSPDIQIGMSTTQYTSVNFTQQATYGQIIYGVTGSYVGFIFNIGGTTNYAYRFNWSANGRQSSFGQESTVLHSYRAPDYCEFYLRMRGMNDNTRYFRITTDNASQVDTLRFAIQSFANNSLAYFTNVAGVGFNVVSPTALVHIGASTTTASALRFASGVAPTTPNDGDIWYDGTNLNFKLPGLLFTNNSGSINTHLTSYVNTAANGNLVQWISNNSANTVTYSAFRQLIAGSGNGYGMLSLAVNQAATGTTLTPYLTADGQWKTVGIFVNTQIGATASTNGILSSAAKSTLDVIGSLSTAVVAKTATYTATISDHTILCNATTGAITINLPAASGIAGREYVIKKTDSSANAITIDANASETIDGALTYTLSSQNKYVFIQTDGTSWYVIANN